VGGTGELWTLWMEGLMKSALVAMAKAFAQMLDAYYASYDRETSDLMRALADWVRANA
jgi:hypothetical protein